MDARVKAIVAHLTILGWIIAFVVNSSNKEEYTSFYLRQALGLHIISFILSFIIKATPMIGWALQMILFAFSLLSLVYAIQGQRKTIPFGQYFQDWFKML